MCESSSKFDVSMLAKAIYRGYEKKFVCHFERNARKIVKVNARKMGSSVFFYDFYFLLKFLRIDSNEQCFIRVISDN